MNSKYFPTYNGLDPFEKFECTESGWSLSDDMKPIECKHVFCPPLIDVGNDVEVACLHRDSACVSLVPGKYYWDDDKKYRHYECNRALYKCKKEGQKHEICLMIKNVHLKVIARRDINMKAVAQSRF